MRTIRLTTLVGITVAVALVATGAVFAGSQPAGPEMVLSAHAADRVHRPDMAVAVDGTVWSVWQSDVGGVVARAFGTDLTPAGPVVRVAGNQLPDQVPYRGPALVREAPVVVPLADGRLFVAWREQSLDLNVDIFYQKAEVVSSAIAGRLLDPSGQPASQRFVIAAQSGDAFGHPVALAAADRRIVVAWTVVDTAGDPAGVGARIVRPNGRALTEVFRLDDGPGGSRPALAPAVGGGFLAAWQEGEDGGVFARTFGADGVARGAAVAVRSGNATLPAVARGEDGSYLATWVGPVAEAGLGQLETRVWGRTLDAAGLPNGPAVALSTGGGVFHGSPGVVAGADGYLVAWSIWGRSFPQSVRGVSVDTLGRPLAQSFRLSERAINFQWSLGLAADAAGRYVVAWDGFDGNDEGSINARLVATPSMAVNLCASGSADAPRCGH